MPGHLHLAPLLPPDEPAALILWERAWQATFPQIDFAARRDWLRERLAQQRARGDRFIGAFLRDEQGQRLAGFLLLACARRAGCGHVDQIAVDPDDWGTGAGRALIDAAKAVCPVELTLSVNADNARARRFYACGGFEIVATGRNPASGLPTLELRWSQVQA
jgi:putative acetyltransferase